jgi:hypothetical protein
MHHFFEKSSLFSREHFKECINLNRTTVVDDKLNITLLERYAKDMEYLKLERLPMSEETLERFRASSSGFVTFENVYLHALPDFTALKLLRISKNLQALSHDTETRDSLCEYWSQVLRIKLPKNVKDPGSKTIFFCLMENGMIYPSCCLLHNVMKPDKFEAPGVLAAKFLTQAKDILEKMDIFEGSVTFANATNSNVKSLQMNVKNFTTLSEVRLKRLNRKVEAPEWALKTASSATSSSSSTMSASKPKQRKLRATSSAEDKENASAKKPLPTKRKRSVESNEDEDDFLPLMSAKKKPPASETAKVASNGNKSLSEKNSSRLLKELNTTVVTTSSSNDDIDDDFLPEL